MFLVVDQLGVPLRTPEGAIVEAPTVGEAACFAAEFPGASVISAETGEHVSIAAVPSRSSDVDGLDISAPEPPSSVHLPVAPPVPRIVQDIPTIEAALEPPGAVLRGLPAPSFDTGHRFGSWVLTYTGRAFFPLDPRAEDIDIHDIAHALSLLCRFTGHTRTFYSVADHCLRVSAVVEAKARHDAETLGIGGDDRVRTAALAGLLHDAAEAYVADVASPVKPWLGGYDQIEGRILSVVMAKYRLPAELPYAVKEADAILLATEARDLMPRLPRAWDLPARPLPDRVVPLTSDEAERRFLLRFEALGGQA